MPSWFVWTVKTRYQPENWTLSKEKTFNRTSMSLQTSTCDYTKRQASESKNKNNNKRLKLN